MSRRLRALALLGLLFAVGLAGIQLGVHGPAVKGLPEGPMDPPWQHRSYLPFSKGEVWTDGLERIQFTDEVDRSDEIVIKKISLVGGSEHMKVLGVLMAGPKRKVGGIQYLRNYPPTRRSLGPLVPAEGAKVYPSGNGHLLLIGLEVIKTGVALRRGINIDYTVNGREFRMFYPAEILLCPKPLTSRQCDAEIGES